MLDCLVGSILSNIVAWELVSSCDSSLQWHRVMHPVKVLLGPHAHVSDKSIVIVTLWAWYCAMAIELLNLFAQEECHILIVNV